MARCDTPRITGLRDYQPGDPLRLIHWPTWARTGKPVVKELEDTFFPRHGLILDTFPAIGDDALFEDAVSVAASFVVAVDARDKAYREQEKLARQIERLKKDIEAEQAAITKIAAERRATDSEQAFLRDFVAKAQANVQALQALLIKLDAPASAPVPASSAATR